MRRSWQKRAAPRITQTGGDGAGMITRVVRRSAFGVRRSSRRSEGSARCYAVLCAGSGLHRRPVRAQRPVISTKPDTPFKLATFEAAGKVRVGLVLGTRVIDIESAHADDRPGDRAARRAGDAARHADADRELRRASRRSLYRIANYFNATQARRRPFVFDVDEGRDQGADQVSVQPPGDRRELQAARRRDVPAGQPAAEGGERSRSGQGRPGVLRQVAALVHHRSRTRATRSRRAATSTGKASWRSSSASRRSRSPKRRRTTTCSATASCTTSAIAAAPAGGR